MYCLYALRHTLSMAAFRSLFPWLVAAQIAGVILIALRIMPLAWIPLVSCRCSGAGWSRRALNGAVDHWMRFAMADARMSGGMCGLEKCNWRVFVEIA